MKRYLLLRALVFLRAAWPEFAEALATIYLPLPDFGRACRAMHRYAATVVDVDAAFRRFADASAHPRLRR